MTRGGHGARAAHEPGPARLDRLRRRGRRHRRRGGRRGDRRGGGRRRRRWWSFATVWTAGRSRAAGASWPPPGVDVGAAGELERAFAEHAHERHSHRDPPTPEQPSQPGPRRPPTAQRRTRRRRSRGTHPGHGIAVSCRGASRPVPGGASNETRSVVAPLLVGVAIVGGHGARSASRSASRCTTSPAARSRSACSASPSSRPPLSSCSSPAPLADRFDRRRLAGDRARGLEALASSPSRCTRAPNPTSTLADLPPRDRVRHRPRIRNAGDPLAAGRHRVGRTPAVAPRPADRDVAGRARSSGPCSAACSTR